VSLVYNIKNQKIYQDRLGFSKKLGTYVLKIAQTGPLSARNQKPTPKRIEM